MRWLCAKAEAWRWRLGVVSQHGLQPMRQRLTRTLGQEPANLAFDAGEATIAALSGPRCEHFAA